VKDRQPPPELLAALKSLAAKDADAAPPADLEARLLEMLRERPGTRARATLPAWAAVAASILAAALLVHRMPRKLTAAQAPFVQVPYVAPPAPYERVEVVHQTVPVAALIAAGFDVHVDDAGGSLPADVLVGQDGRVLAVRLDTRRIP